MSNFFIINKLFYILLSGHLIGDFVLQTDSVFIYKNKNIFGQIYHSLIVTISTLIILIFMYRYNIYISIMVLIVFITHFAIDYIKLEFKRKNPFLFLLDQALHVMIIIFLSIIFDKKSGIVIYERYMRFFLLMDFLIIILFFVKYFSLSIFSYFNIKIDNYKRYNIIAFYERVLIFILAYMHGYYFYIIPIMIIPRLFIAIKYSDTNILYDILFSILFSSFFGISLRKLTLTDSFSFIWILISVIILTLTGKIISLFVDRITKRYILQSH